MKVDKFSLFFHVRLADMNANHRSALSQAFFVARAWYFLTFPASFNIAIVADLNKDMVFRESEGKKTNENLKLNFAVTFYYIFNLSHPIILVTD